jgi:putative PIN family toxin of toxin-antitoxin system
MRVVIDTNVLVSAALKNRDPEIVIRWVAAHSDWWRLVSEEILAEYRAILSRPKFGLSPDLCERWFRFLNKVTTLVVIDSPIMFPRDQKDAIFLACALTGQADYLITGDRDFTEARKLISTTILSVAQFKRLVCDVVP